MSGIGNRSPYPIRNRRSVGGDMDTTGPNVSFAPIMTNPQQLLSAATATITTPVFNLNRPSPTSTSTSYISPRRHFDFSAAATSVASFSLHSTKNIASSTTPGTAFSFDLQQQATAQDLDDDEPMNVEEIRQISQYCSNVVVDPPMAAFYASIVYTRTQTLEDAYLYAKTLWQNEEYKRAIQILMHHLQGPSAPSNDSTSQDLECVLLAAQCHAKMGDWSEAIRILEDASIVNTNNATPMLLEDDDDAGWRQFAKAFQTTPTAATSSMTASNFSKLSPTAEIHPVARLCLWRGRAYDETSHPPRAKIYWIRALELDSKCVQAFDLLLKRNLLNAREAHDLIMHRLQFGGSSMDWLKTLYLARIPVAPQDPEQIVATKSAKKQRHDATEPNLGVDASSIQMATPSIQMKTFFADEDDTMISHGKTQKFRSKSKTVDQHHQKLPRQPPIEQYVDNAIIKLWKTHSLGQSSEVLALAAIRAFRRYDMQAAFDYCQELAYQDPLCPKASFVYAATLLALQYKRLLFALAHEWVEASPQSARAWFAVGCYYYSCQRYHVAQKHFCRATRLDPLCVEAWLGFGCAFAACDESDQALAAFRAAQRLAPEEPAALLYMGMEYCRTNHLVLAQHSLRAAAQSSGDPLCYHELGVTCLSQKAYGDAIAWFTKTLRAVTKSKDHYIESVQNDFWEPTLFNLGHCFRKTRQWDKAKECFEKCLVLLPDNSSALFALGFTKHLCQDYDGAIELYHQALGRKPDDPFGLEVLNRALHDALHNNIEDSMALPSPSPSSALGDGGGGRVANSSMSLDDDMDMSCMST